MRTAGSTHFDLLLRCDVDRGQRCFFAGKLNAYLIFFISFDMLQTDINSSATASLFHSLPNAIPTYKRLTYIGELFSIESRSGINRYEGTGPQGTVFNRFD